MPSPELVPYKRAILDQYHAYLAEVVGFTIDHLAAGECQFAPGACVGPDTSASIEALSPEHAKMLLEVAIVQLAELRTGGV